jgi:hypothetical protein
MTVPDPEAGSLPSSSAPVAPGPGVRTELIVLVGAALAMADHPHRAGSASALVGAAQFLVGAAAAPLVGAAGSTSAVPMAITMALLECAALATFMVLTGRSPVLAGR